MSKLKLGVEVVSAHNLMPKDGQGSCSAFVELSFDGQKFRTTTKEKELNPLWNEIFYFNVSDPDNLHNLTLEACVYHSIKNNQSRSFLGKVCLTETSFVSHVEAVVLHYPLEKRRMFSHVKGELGLKVFVTDDPSIKCSNPLPAVEPSAQMDTHSNHQTSFTRWLPKPMRNPFSTDKAERRTFHHLPKPQNHSPAEATPRSKEATISYEPKSERQPPRMFPMYSSSSYEPVDYTLKETSPYLGGGKVVGGRVIRGGKLVSTYDLVEKMEYLYVRVVKAQDLSSKDASGSLDPYVEVKVGNYKGITKHFEKIESPEWNEVFAFSRERLQSSVLEVVVKDKDVVKDDIIGLIRFDLNEIPTRVPPDSPLAPEWYRLEGKNGKKKKGEVMLAVWIGTQADEAFPDAWHSDTVSDIDGFAAASLHLRSKVYHSPRLWYVRVNVIEAQDLVLADKNHFPDVYVKAQIGGQILKTRPIQTRSLNALWNEEFMFVAAEPFDEPLILSVEDCVGPNKDTTVGKVVIPLTHVDKRADDRHVNSRWFNLDNPYAIDTDEVKRDKFASRLHLHLCLDGGYHVLDESTHYSSDLRPTVKQLWKPSVGVLELGILNADGLHPMKISNGKGTANTYCVAKYGQKWIRTRTIINSLSPRYNEQYTWDVYDPATVLTVGVFDNSQIGEMGKSEGNKDVNIGKVRIRISTLETGRVYTHTYPLLVLHPSGVKKRGDLHLAIRFSCTSVADTMFTYSRPLLPKMHYIRPLTVIQVDMLRHQAVTIVAARLGRAEPPLRKEVVEYMSDTDSHLWSMRRSKANFFRVVSVFSGLISMGKWFGEVCMWKNPVTTALVHVLFLMLVCFPELILPTVFLYMFFIGAWNYRYRPKYPPHMNTVMSYADRVHPDELDEEFDTFPTSKSSDLIRMRYDRMRSMAGRIQTVVGDLASQGERVQGLLSWRDPRATFIFMVSCLLATIVLYVTPFQVLVLLAGFYAMRHPRFRNRMPPAPVNFFRRLPAKTDSML